MFVVAPSRYGFSLGRLHVLGLLWDPVRWQNNMVDSDNNLRDMRDYLAWLTDQNHPDPELARALAADSSDVDQFIGTLLDRCAGGVYLPEVRPRRHPSGQANTR